MNAALILFAAMMLLLLAYQTYGRFVARRLNIDPANRVPSHAQRDGVDYEPAAAPVVLGHHFASIAGAGPIVGPIAAAAFGWLPALIWILVGSVFIGAVHDFTALVASLRHQGRSVGDLIEDYIGARGKRLFIIFALATLVLVIAVFTNVVVTTFEAQPRVASASVFFVGAAVVFGLLIRFARLALLPATVIGIFLLIAALWLSTTVGFSLPEAIEVAGIAIPSTTIWVLLVLAYVAVAAVTPVWLLLQPRDYLNSFLLYAMMFGAIAGIFVARPTMELASFEGFHVENVGFVFPLLFVTVACGAISGFHSLVASGTTSKQLDSEGDATFVGYGAMLIEAVLAVVALIAASVLDAPTYTYLRDNPIGIFSTGVGTFMTALNLPLVAATTFVALTISAFALTTLDTCARLARFLVQELATDRALPAEQQPLLSRNRYVSTALVVAAGAGLTFSGQFSELWPVFGSANQLLAALALLSVATWLAHRGTRNLFVVAPMLFMYVVTVAALGQLVVQNLRAETPNYLLALVSGTLLLLSLELLRQAASVLKVRRPRAEQATS